MLNNLKALRDAAGLTQEYVAKQNDVSQQAVAKWETGRAMPQADKLPKLAETLGCSVSDLFDK